MANYFAVGLPFTFDGTTNHFATSSGGTATVAAPLSTDTVTFDGNSGTGTCTFTANMTCSTFTCSSANVTISPGAKTITIGATSGTAWTFSAGTFTAGTSIISVSGNVTFAGGGKTYNEVDFTGTDQVNITGANTFAILSRTNTSGVPLLTIAANQTVSTTLTLTGNNANSQRLIVCTNDSLDFSTGIQRTITCNGSLTLTNVDFADIIGAGSATWSGTSVGDCGNNSGITFTSPVTRYWVGDNGSYHATTNWATSSNGASGASMPLPQDTAIFDANSISASGKTIDVHDQLRVGTVDFSAVLHSPTFGHGTFTINYYGSITLAAGMTINSHLSLRGRNNNTVVMNTATLGTILIALDSATGIYTFNDNFTANNSMNYKGGTFTANNVDMNLTGVFFNGGNTRTINMGSGTWTLTGNSPWTGSSFDGVTINSQTSTILLTGNSASSMTFGFSGGGPYTYNNLTVNTSGAGAVAIQQNNTFTTLVLSAGCNVQFPATNTQTITNLTATGTSLNNITITSSSAGTQATLSKSSGTVSCNYLSLKDSAATGGATWYAGVNSTNVSNNSGWIFNTAPVLVLDTTVTSESINLLSIDNVSVPDTITTSESIQRLITSSVVVSDSTATSEVISRLAISNINVSDSVTDSESMVALIPTLLALVNDSTITSETINLLGTNRVSVSDSTTASESIKLLNIDNISVSDSVAVSESIKLLNTGNVNVSDTTATSENVTLLIPTLSILASDTTVTSESISASDQDGITVLDSVVISENLSINVAAAVTVNDSTTIAESTAETVFLFITVSDATLTSENVRFGDVKAINLNDSIMITESVTVAALPVFVDSQTLRLIVPAAVGLNLTIPGPIAITEVII